MRSKRVFGNSVDRTTKLVRSRLSEFGGFSCDLKKPVIFVCGFPSFACPSIDLHFPLFAVAFLEVVSVVVVVTLSEFELGRIFLIGEMDNSGASIRFTLLLLVFVAKLLFHGQLRPTAAVTCVFGGMAVPLFGLLSSHDDGLYGEPGSDASLDVVLESVQLNVATPLQWKRKKLN